MGRRRGYWPPATCEKCGNPPDLGESLWPGDQWRCLTCLEEQLPGRDLVTKWMDKTVEYHHRMQIARHTQANGETELASEAQNEAEWTGAIAADLKAQGTARATNVPITHGEAVPPHAETYLHDTLADPDLVAIDASLDRSRLLLDGGMNVAAMALDTANTIKANNSLEKMLAHQLALAHKMAMRQIGRAEVEYDSVTQLRRLNVATRFMAVFQQGLLALHKLRHGGRQDITVHYLNLSDGGQAVIGDLKRGDGPRHDR